MEGALVILGIMIVAGLLLYITDVKYFRHHHSSQDSDQQTEGESVDQPKKDSEPEVCCGMHIVCEKTSLQVSDNEIIYYDDEELDRFKGRSPLSYTNVEIEEFRDVLLTLLPQDITGWAKSIRLRNIELPDEIRDELLILVSELRDPKFQPAL